MKKLTCILFLLVSGCYTAGYTPKTAIWEPRTEFGRAFKARYFNELQDLLIDLRSNSELSDITVAMFFGPGADSASKYVGAHMGTYKKYNTLRTNFEQRAATTLSTTILPVLQAISKQNAPLHDLQINGASVTFAWIAADFLHEYSSEVEAVQLFVPTPVLSDYLTFKISNQDLIRKSFVVGYKSGHSIGRIEFDINKNF